MEPQMRGRNYSFRDYFRATRRTGKPYISKPFFSTQHSAHPIVMFTAPVFDSKGSLVAIVAGSLDLLKENFLGGLSSVRVGQGGYLCLYGSDGTVLLQPDRSRLLRSHVPVGVSRQSDRGVDGFEGTRETVDARGIPSLSSFKHLQSVGWILACNFPLREAYAPIARARHYFLLGLALLAGIFFPATWFFLRRMTSPLEAFTEHVRRIADGETGWIPVPVGSPDELGTLAEVFNQMLTEMKSRKKAVKEQKEFAEKLLQNAAAPIFVIDSRHRVLIWNRACELLTGLKRGELKGTESHWRGFYDHPCSCLVDLAVDDSPENWPEHYASQPPARLPEGGLQAEGWRTCVDGRKKYLIFRAAPIRNEYGEIVAGIETLEDITAQKEAEKRMEVMAHFDLLTGLPNRALFFDRLGRELSAAARFGDKLALLYVDLDGFKQINDGAGHDVGDRVLVEVAGRLQRCIRACDTVARLGGDEFGVILARLDHERGARVAAERILESLVEPLTPGTGAPLVGASIGISFYPEHGDDADTLLKKADTAMYHVKANGKNHSRFFVESGQLRAGEA